MPRKIVNVDSKGVARVTEVPTSLELILDLPIHHVFDNYPYQMRDSARKEYIQLLKDKEELEHLKHNIAEFKAEVEQEIKDCLNTAKEHDRIFDEVTTHAMEMTAVLGGLKTLEE